VSNTFNVSYNAGGTIDKVRNIKELESVQSMENLVNVEVVQKIEEIGSLGSIKGFATKTQPYNVMKMIDIPAGVEEIQEVIVLPNKEVEILAFTVTCSGYGEDDKYDLYFNGKLWFENWYCSEVKEGLFLGTSTYVYLAPPESRIRIHFHNSSNTSKKVWIGVRMLVDDEQA
jgi:hypothetical protein